MATAASENFDRSFGGLENGSQADAETENRTARS
jgi:hypothetical protein